MRLAIPVALALTFAPLAPALAQADSRQVGPAPAVAGAPVAKRSPASPHPNCVRDRMGKCQPTAAAKKHAQSR